MERSAALCLNLHPSSSCWWGSAVSCFIKVSGNCLVVWLCNITTFLTVSKHLTHGPKWNCGRRCGKLMLRKKNFSAHDKPQLSFSNDITVCFWPSAVLGSDQSFYLSHSHRLKSVAVGTSHMLGLLNLTLFLQQYVSVMVWLGLKWESEGKLIMANIFSYGLIL